MALRGVATVVMVGDVEGKTLLTEALLQVWDAEQRLTGCPEKRGAILFVEADRETLQALAKLLYTRLHVRLDQP